MADTCPTPLAPSQAGLYWSTQTNGQCRWEKNADTDLTRYSIMDMSGSATVAKGTTQGKSISFSSFSTHTYKCVLSYINSCGESTTFEVNSAVVIRPTPTDAVASISATLAPSPEASASPTIASKPTESASPSAVIKPTLRPTIKKLPTTLPTTVPTEAPKSNSGSIILLGVLFFVLVLLGLAVFLLKKKGGGGTAVKKTNPGNTKDPKDASGLYYVKPYKLEDEGKSMWLILTQGETQILGLYSGTSAAEGNAKIKGKYEEADGVKFIEIETLTSL